MGIKFEGVSKAFGGAVALDDVSLDVSDGDFAVLLGPTGAGKTTLLRTICGVERPNVGRILFDDVDVTSVTVRKRPVAMVYQQFVNYPSLTVYENIASPIRLMRPKLSREEIDRRVCANAELLGVDALLKRRPEELSGGQQQRTAIARALAKEARYILLDEPLANLDYKLREELRSELKNLFRERGGAVIYATSEPIDALAMGTHVGLMQGGRIAHYGLVDEVYHRPSNADVAAYFSHPLMNLWDAECVKNGGRVQVRVADGIELDYGRDLPEGPCLVGVRAHHVRLESPEDRHCAVDASLDLAEVVGSDTELHLSRDGLPIIALANSVRRFDPGDMVRVFIDPSSCFIFDASTRALVAAPESA
jgi:glycerol transport system ATP-binding protein